MVNKMLRWSLAFQEGTAEMCDSPKVEEGVENKYFTSLTYILGQFLLKNFKLPYILNR